ncbi:hypothetical protein C8J56DRAFT_361005 [Mycena floridula]|nr:hypothetical protein C8J56DRAFT_361005 [Mycena floridula]
MLLPTSAMALASLVSVCPGHNQRCCWLRPSHRLAPILNDHQAAGIVSRTRDHVAPKFAGTFASAHHPTFSSYSSLSSSFSGSDDYASTRIHGHSRPRQICSLHLRSHFSLFLSTSVFGHLPITSRFPLTPELITLRVETRHASFTDVNSVAKALHVQPDGQTLLPKLKHLTVDLGRKTGDNAFQEHGWVEMAGSRKSLYRLQSLLVVGRLQGKALDLVQSQLLQLYQKGAVAEVWCQLSDSGEPF